jgi:hypothetical protein
MPLPTAALPPDRRADFRSGRWVPEASTRGSACADVRQEAAMADMSPIDVQKALKGADYPASRDDLVSLARSNGADEKVVDKLSHAGTKKFDGPNDVQKAIFGNA